MDDVKGFYVRSVPMPSRPAMKKDDTLVLYEDWFTAFTQTRERAAYFLAWLLQLSHRGATLVNGPHAASVLQHKPFQLHALRASGAQVPRTLISNDPAAIRAFHADVKDVIYKPMMGGAETRTLDAEALERLEEVTASPVIFQERFRGTTCGSRWWGTRSSRAWPSRHPRSTSTSGSDPIYSTGEAIYREVSLPEPVQRLCRAARPDLRADLRGNRH